jgi:hypothetical protein
LKAYQNFGKLFFFLELDLDACLELLQLLLDIFEKQTNPMEKENNDLDAPM